MTALTPTLVGRAADGTRHFVTPPPEHILPAEVQQAAQGCATAISLGLGLRSLAAVDGFVHADTGELIVLDVKPFPSLADGSPLWQQAAAAEPPMLPHQLLRQLARSAWTANAAAKEAAAAGASSIASAYYSAPSGAGGRGLDADDFDLGSAADVFAGAGAGGDADEQQQVEDMMGGLTM